MLPPSSSSTLQLAPEALDPEFVAVILAGRTTTAGVEEGNNNDA